MDFKTLLQDSLSISFGGSRIIPPIFRSLDQVESESKSRSKQGASSSSLKNGQFFLAKEGSLHPERLESQIKDLPKLADTYEPQVYISGTDFESFLKHEEEVLILSLLEESRKAATQEMSRLTLKTREAEWDRQKKKILQSFNVAIGSEPAAAAAYSFTPKQRIQQSKQHSEFSLGSTLRMNPKMHQYANAVIEMNEARSRSNPFNIIAAFRNLSDSDASFNQIFESWELLSFVLGRDPTIQHIYTNSYKETYDSQVAMSLRQKFITGAKSFLENQLMKFIEKTIAQQPREASMGGRPGAVDKVKGFLQIRLRQYGRWDSTIEVVDDTPIWAVIFYLIRCGYWDQALKVSMQYETYFEREDPNFITYLKSYKENNDDFRLPKHLRSQIQMDYTQKVRQQADRFKLAVYKVLGRCDLSRKTLNDVITTKEDYMWLQLSLVRETPEVDFATDSYNLMDLRRILSKFGPEHFTSKTANPLNYFQVLLLSFQFESVCQLPLIHGHL